MPRNQKTLSLSQLRVGIFMLVALLVLGFLILNSTGDFNPFEKKMDLRARFVSADGLRPNAEVQLAGVSVGKVEEVRFLPPDPNDENRIEASFSVVRTLDNKPISDLIRTDSNVQLIATSVLGNDKMLNITPGSAKGSPITENAILQSSAANSISQLTSTGNDLLKQINRLAIPANEILEKANRGEGTLGQIINDDALYRNLDTTLTETKATMARLQTTLETVNSGRGSAGKLLNDPQLYNNLNRTAVQLEAISSDLRRGRGSAGKFFSDEALYNETRAAIADLRVSVAKFNGIADDVRGISTGITEGRGSAGKFFRDEQLYDNARDTLARFNTTATKLEAMLTDAQNGKGTVGKLLTDESLFNNINQTAGNVNQFSAETTKLIYDFRQNPKKYLSIKLSIF